MLEPLQALFSCTKNNTICLTALETPCILQRNDILMFGSLTSSEFSKSYNMTEDSQSCNLMQNCDYRFCEASKS